MKTPFLEKQFPFNYIASRSNHCFLVFQALDQFLSDFRKISIFIALRFGLPTYCYVTEFAGRFGELLFFEKFGYVNFYVGLITAEKKHWNTIIYIALTVRSFAPYSRPEFLLESVIEFRFGTVFNIARTLHCVLHMYPFVIFHFRDIFHLNWITFRHLHLWIFDQRNPLQTDVSAHQFLINISDCLRFFFFSFSVLNNLSLAQTNCRLFF